MTPILRISVDETDVGYKTWMDHGGPKASWKVFLDTKPVHDVVMADAMFGKVVVLARNPEGKLIRDDRTGKAMRITKHGRVVIIPPPKEA